MRRTILVMAMAALMVALTAGMALAVVKNGGPGDNTLRGTSAPDELNGNKGDDKLFGLGRQDVLSGGSGDDFIKGGAGRDSIFGGFAPVADDPDTPEEPTGDDTIFGGPGGDSISGGVGNDAIHGDAGPDEIFGNTGRDRIVVAEEVFPKKGEVDEVSCGGGTDVVVVDPNDEVADDCEKVEFNKPVTTQ